VCSLYCLRLHHASCWRRCASLRFQADFEHHVLVFQIVLSKRCKRSVRRNNWTSVFCFNTLERLPTTADHRRKKFSAICRNVTHSLCLLRMSIIHKSMMKTPSAAQYSQPSTLKRKVSHSATSTSSRLAPSQRAMARD